MEELTSEKSCHLIIDNDCEDLWNYSYHRRDYGQDVGNRLCLDKKMFSCLLVSVEGRCRNVSHISDWPNDLSFT